MLRNSWKILVNRSLNFEGVVPRGSYSLRITERLWGSGAWLIWLSPPAELETQASVKANDASRQTLPLIGHNRFQNIEHQFGDKSLPFLGNALDIRHFYYFD